MAEPYEPTGGENFDLRDVLLRGRRVGFQERMGLLSDWWSGRINNRSIFVLRTATTMADREIQIEDPYTGDLKPMLMFGSNNYLGLTSHPYVLERVKKAVDEYGAGVGGPPLLNGYTKLHQELEARLSALKDKEDTVIFQSGYGANVGALGSLPTRNDAIFYDLYSHASFIDGLQMTRAVSYKFAHNDVDELARLLEAHGTRGSGDAFVGVEGVYSMDGDVAPLDEITRLCKQHGAILLLDDAHGTGVMGPNGRGTPHHFGVERDVDVVMSTFSKAFGVVGGAISTSKPIADYLRFCARSYMFSSSIPPATVAAVLAGLDLLERDEGLVQRLWDNVDYTGRCLREIGFDIHPQTPIIPLLVPQTMHMRKATYFFHQSGIFLNPVEYPAVPIDKQRFRISLMATHTREDIDRLVEVVAEAWRRFAFALDPKARTAA
ncbi:hypothetical protein AWN76_012920 [Rhodothermaceae bacterium RA]|nr:hypothetical protein AWN76_012920 [Rhodothermaceae bacterium RA]